MLHAVMDALLGAAALGDIGRHFPDSDDKYKGISSLKLLGYVGKMLEDKCYIIENIDATIIAQKPKISGYIDEMCANIAGVLGLEQDQVNIKATTEEGLGFTGACEGIASQAVCSINSMFDYSVDVTRQAGDAKGKCQGCSGCSKL